MWEELVLLVSWAAVIRCACPEPDVLQAAPFRTDSEVIRLTQILGDRTLRRRNYVELDCLLSAQWVRNEFWLPKRYASSRSVAFCFIHTCASVDDTRLARAFFFGLTGWSVAVIPPVSLRGSIPAGLNGKSAGLVPITVTHARCLHRFRFSRPSDKRPPSHYVVSAPAILLRLFGLLLSVHRHY